MPPSLAPVWRDYLTRRRVLASALVGLVPIVMTFGELAGSDTPRHLVAAAWITGSVGAALWFAAFRCPFCRNPFHWTLWVANPLSSECLHCGFRKWRDPHAARVLTRR